MKRYISVLLCLILLCSSLHMPVLCASLKSPSLSLDSASAAAGEKISINVYLKNNPGIVSACINVSFDLGLTLIGAKNGNVFPSTIKYLQPKQLSNGGTITGGCNFVWSGVDIDDKDIKDGVLLTLTFALPEIAKSGENYNISVSARKGDIVDKDLSYLEVETAKGVVAIQGEISESGDGETPKNSIGTFIDWLYRLIEKIKALFSKLVVVKENA